MLTYNIKKRDNSISSLNINLLDTPFAINWKRYLIELSERLPLINWNLMPGGCKATTRKYAMQVNVPQKLIELEEAFTFLQTELGIDYVNEINELKYLIGNPSSLRQHHLNIWHRHFTTRLNAWYENKWSSGNLVLPYKLTADDTYYNIHLLNQCSHDLETVTYPYLENINVIKGHWFHSIRCTDSREFQIKDQLFGSEKTEIITELFEFEPIDDNYRHTVWLNEDIQGKDQFKSWLEDDDFTAIDCTGNLMNTPNIMLDPDRLFEKIIDNPNWQEQHRKSGKPLNRWPIGDIVDTDEFNWNSLQDSLIESIMIDDNILWKIND